MQQARTSEDTGGVSQQNLGVCSSCRAIVPVVHQIEHGQVYLRKDCPQCGISRALISTDARVWEGKRRTWRYGSAEAIPCTLNCRSCRHNHEPAMVFVDVTNRCNMNCPICIANVPAMGYTFNPPLEYFETLFAALSKLDPRPRINLFGGEPTVRDDLPEIIDIARRRGLSPRVVTNGLRFADEDYCRRMAATKTPLLFALDGLSADVYERLRKNPGAFEKKMKALENLKRLGERRITIMACVARRINEHEMPGLIRFCHDNRDFIKALHMIPLTETWEEGEFETDVATTIEDVERIVDEALPGEEAEFWSAGLPARLEPILRFLGSVKLTFGGVHPNCESMTLLVSDGERYRPLRSFTRRSMNEVLAQLVDRALELEPFLSRLDTRDPLQRGLGILRVVGAVGPAVAGLVDLRKVLRGNPLLACVRVLLGIAAGQKPKESLRANSPLREVLHMVVLPFEEYHSVESERLCHCKAAFAYVDPTTDCVGLVPVCAWSLHQKTVLRSIAEKYGGAVPAMAPTLS
jgi:uncharacterized radical SAM superfamily Fe-S cluster-containing enzyme